jgi:amidase
MADHELSGAQYHKMLVEIADAKRSMLEFMQRFDIIVCPVCSNVAPRHSRREPIDYSFSILFSLLGWPVATLRVSEARNGLPIGVQIAAKPWMEHQALAVASALEMKLGGWQKPQL